MIGGPYGFTIIPNNIFDLVENVLPIKTQLDLFKTQVSSCTKVIGKKVPVDLA